MQATDSRSYRFSGHETSPCRYTWLPKAVRNLSSDRSLFANDDGAMVRLGVGKNMVRAIRFWADAAAVVSKGGHRSEGLDVSAFGQKLFGAGGHDEFLEESNILAKIF